MATKFKYLVVSPRPHPKGTPIITDPGGQSWKEGDIYTGKKIKHWLERGRIKKVGGSSD